MAGTQSRRNKMEKEKILKRIKLCFKPNDVRCVAGIELDEEIAYRTAHALVVFLKTKEIIVGHDMRTSSHKLKNAFIKGVLEQGVNVIDIGEIDSPGLYFASGFLKKPATMIAAPHNPAKYNGLKLVRKGALPIGEDSGLLKIRSLVEKNKFAKSSSKGKIIRKNISKVYKKHVQSFVNKNKIRNVKIVVDGGNGMTGKIVPIVYKNLDVKIVPLDFRLDGTFPNHEANPSKLENILDLRKKVVETNSDFGIAFDGDMDRVFFVDEKGRAISSGVISALIVKNICLKHRERIVYNVPTSRIVPLTTIKYSGVPLREKVGHSFIKARMKKEKATFGCEHSAHYYYKNNFYADSGIITSLKILEIFSLAKQNGKKFSEIIKEFQTYAQTPELSFVVEDKNLVLRKIEKHYKKSAKSMDRFDGLTVNFKDWWFNVRPSNTEPLLRINAEAENKRILKEKLKSLLRVIKR